MKETRCSAAFCFLVLAGTIDRVVLFLSLYGRKPKGRRRRFTHQDIPEVLARMCMPPNKAPPNLKEEAIRAIKGGQLKVIPRLCGT